MDTKVIVLEEDTVTRECVEEAGEVIKKGGLVAFPTETVYGLGGDALSADSSRKIYAAKGRPSDNPLIVHIADWEAIEEIVSEIPVKAKQLADAFWPGPLTMIFQKSDRVPLETTGGLQTVAVRMPSHKIAREFIRAAGGYVAAPSANLSGRPSPTLAKYVLEDMNGRIDYVIDGGDIGIGLESTIVDFSEEKPMILRPGYITKAMMESVIGEVVNDVTMMEVVKDVAPKAPGMKYRHYAPKGELTIVTGNSSKVVAFINEALQEAKAAGRKTGVIATEETYQLYQADVVKNIGSREDEESIARGLYKALREFDDEGIEVMYTESFDSDGLGQAVMNRLLKAAGHKVITLS